MQLDTGKLSVKVSNIRLC